MSQIENAIKWYKQCGITSEELKHITYEILQEIACIYSNGI